MLVVRCQRRRVSADSDDRATVVLPALYLDVRIYAQLVVLRRMDRLLEVDTPRSIAKREDPLRSSSDGSEVLIPSCPLAEAEQACPV